MISFEFDITPRGKGRPRFMRRGKFIRVFTDPATAKFESAIKKMAQAEMKKNKWKPMEGPLEIIMVITMPRPKSLKKSEFYAPHTKKPDIDNIIKGVFDPLNEVAWKDDAQIAHVEAFKHYGDTPGIGLTISEYANPR